MISVNGSWAQYTQAKPFRRIFFNDGNNPTSFIWLLIYSKAYQINMSIYFVNIRTNQPLVVDGLTYLDAADTGLQFFITSENLEFSISTSIMTNKDPV